MQIPYFDSTQDPLRDRPAKHVSLEEARQLKKAKTHFFVNHGSAIQELPKVALTAAACERGAVDVDGKPRKERGSWMIVGQTKKPGFAGYLDSWGPGNPHYSFV